MKFKNSIAHKILKSIKYKLVAIYIYTINLNKVLNWLKLQIRLFILWWIDAPKYQRDIEKGVFFLKRGTMYQVGQPFKIIDTTTGKTRMRYIANLKYNFKDNEVQHQFSDKPIKGFSEKFIVKKKTFE